MVVPVAIENDEGGTVPLDLTQASSQDVGRQHSAYAARLAHGLFLVGQIAAQIANLKFDISIAKAHKDDDLEDMQRRLVELQHSYKLTEAVVKGYEVMLRAASREISRRSAEKAQAD